MGNYRNRESCKPVKRNVDDCVCDVVRNIVEVQDEVMDNCCATGCDSSIQQLRGAKYGLDPQNTTVPFVLFCSGTCKPFIGSGVFQSSSNGESFFGCAESPVFRAKHFVKGSDCCVKLELLLPVAEGCGIVAPVLDNCSNSICSFFPADDHVTDFLATGICLTVNLNDFIGITGLGTLPNNFL